MLHLPTNGQQIFEFCIYNQEVRSLVKENQSHKFFDDHWADVQKHDVEATDEGAARELIARRYPPDDGFVIAAVSTTSV